MAKEAKAKDLLVPQTDGRTDGRMDGQRNNLPFPLRPVCRRKGHKRSPPGRGEGAGGGMQKEEEGRLDLGADLIIVTFFFGASNVI